MKKMKRLATASAATILALSMIAGTTAMSAFADPATYTITINQNSSDKGSHTYTAYQVFSATVTTSADGNTKTLTQITWGNGVNSEGLLGAIVAANAESGNTFNGLFTGITANSSAEDLAAKLTNLTEAQQTAFAKLVAKYATGTTTALNAATSGYYVIKDTVTNANGDNSGATSAYMLQVVDANLTVTAKSSAPTVDKQVQDETADAEAGSTDGWGETADHAINETFNFKLTATLPSEEYIDDYNAYKLVFTDTLGKGVVYDGNVVVTVKSGNSTKTLGTSDYTIAGATAGTTTNASWTLTIANLKQLLPEGVTSLQGVTVEVVYEAHLDADAAVAGTATDNNQNKVKLEYSNNPNYTGTGSTGSGTDDESDTTGSTPEDTVFVYTYKVNNTKYKNSAVSGNELGGAEFNLKDSNNTAIAFSYNSTLKAYVPDSTGSTTITSLNTDDTDKGTFNIVGLDAGTYTLTETKAPSGFNTANDITITISATHSEGANETPTLTLTETNGTNNVVDVEKSSTLPETGGIGTKLFYVGGGAVVLASGVLLVTKKRMKNRA